MTSLKITYSFLVFCLLATICVVDPARAGESKKVNTGPDNLAIKGYDPVAYFTRGQPVKGKPDYAHSWNGAQWLFANANHRDMFTADPERYAPQFGGFCAMALTRSKIAGADPQSWVIVDGKLYLNFSKPALETFQENTHENIKKAEVNWEKIHKAR